MCRAVGQLMWGLPDRHYAESYIKILGWEPWTLAPWGPIWWSSEYWAPRQTELSRLARNERAMLSWMCGVRTGERIGISSSAPYWRNWICPTWNLRSGISVCGGWDTSFVAMDGSKRSPSCGWRAGMQEVVLERTGMGRLRRTLDWSDWQTDRQTDRQTKSGFDGLNTSTSTLSLTFY